MFLPVNSSFGVPKGWMEIMGNFLKKRVTGGGWKAPQPKDPKKEARKTGWHKTTGGVFVRGKICSREGGRGGGVKKKKGTHSQVYYGEKPFDCAQVSWQSWEKS